MKPLLSYSSVAVFTGLSKLHPYMPTLTKPTQTRKHVNHLPLLETNLKIDDVRIDLGRGYGMTIRIGLGLNVLFLLSWWSQGKRREIIN